MDNELLNKIERNSIDRDFFILNKNRILESYKFLDQVLARYIDVCCMKFKSFAVNKTSYIYGSIMTLAVAFVISKEKHFNGASGDVYNYLIRDIYPIFVETYQTENLVAKQTQIHMLKGYVDEYSNLASKKSKYFGGKFDKYFDQNLSDICKKYLNQILTYCAERKCDGYTDENVALEILPLIQKIF